MKPIHRSLAGLALAVVSLPVFLSLLACLPVPVGDPDKSRIDPDLSGVWYMAGDGAIVLLEPFDKRTWLMSAVPVTFDYNECPLTEDEADSMDEYELFIARLEEFGGACFEPKDGVALYKVWNTRLGDRWFMIWEPKGVWFDDIGFEPQIWFVLRLDKRSADEFSVVFVDADYFADVDGFKELEDNMDAEIRNDPREVRRVGRAVERMIRRNADDPELYFGDDPGEFNRIPADHVGKALDIIDDVLTPDYPAWTPISATPTRSRCSASCSSPPS